jgi:hypothetical protein
MSGWMFGEVFSTLLGVSKTSRSGSSIFLKFYSKSLINQVRNLFLAFSPLTSLFPLITSIEPSWHVEKGIKS